METNRFLMFYQSFERVVKDIKRKEMSYMSEYGLRSVHLRCLLRINQSEKGMTITQLSKATNTDKALISRVVKELSNDGFLENKNAKEEKSYNKKYYLTEKSEKTGVFGGRKAVFVGSVFVSGEAFRTVLQGEQLCPRGG